MSSVSFRVPNRVALLINWLATRYRCLMFAHYLGILSRRLVEGAEEVDVELRPTALIATGHYRAAVYAARTTLEQQMTRLCQLAPAAAALNPRACMGAMVPFAVHWGLIAKPKGRRIAACYGRASRIVHAQSRCRVQQALDSVAELQTLSAVIETKITELELDRPMVIAGFA